MGPEIYEGETQEVASTNTSWRVQFFEVLVFLFLIVPSLALSFLANQQGNIGFTVTAIATILRDLALVSLILFFLWQNRENVGQIGWKLRNGWGEVLLGMILFVPVFFGADLLDSFLNTIGFSSPKAPLPSFLQSSGISQTILAIILVIVVAITEETIFRGYLILRFKSLTNSAALAAILSAVVFSIGHGYEGSAGVITVGTLGLVFALVYLWRGSLIAPMVMHFLQDFISIVLLSLLGKG
jgi:membrane protease YdiL (CAAX protease family)